MPPQLETSARWPLGLAALVAAQVFCAVFFLIDVVEDFRAAPGAGWHLTIEFFATLCLIAAIVFEIGVILRILRRQAHLERSVSIASSAMQDVIDAYFEAWKLTPTEQDVATFLVKGLSISEIAALRGSAEGTIKSHLNSIYRKSGTRSRGDLLSCLIEDLMGAPKPSDISPGPSD